MLMPKKVKYRKQQRGRMAGKAWRGSELSFGDFGLKALSCGWVTNRQIEAARIPQTRIIQPGGKKSGAGVRGRPCSYKCRKLKNAFWGCYRGGVGERRKIERSRELRRGTGDACGRCGRRKGRAAKPRDNRRPGPPITRTRARR